MSVLLLSLAGAASAPQALGPAVSASAVRGEYVEVRTASVFAGACHYNGERVTEGRSALSAWNFEGGSFEGVDLSGVKVLAAIACDENLAESSAARRSAMTVDADTDAKAAAAVAWIKSQCADQLGVVVHVRRAPVAFRDVSEAFTVSSKDFGSLSVTPMPDHACCSQPQLVWYQPLMALDDRRVGYTQSASLNYNGVGPTWQRADENSAIYGHFGR
jgi:hypothetical protein